MAGPARVWYRGHMVFGLLWCMLLKYSLAEDGYILISDCWNQERAEKVRQTKINVLKKERQTYEQKKGNSGSERAGCGKCRC